MQYDQRYHRLRKKLDSLRYMQPLHPDSVELVDRILKDLIRIKGELENQRQKGTKTSSSRGESFGTGSKVTNNSEQFKSLADSQALSTHLSTENPLLNQSYQLDLMNERNYELQQQVSQLQEKLQGYKHHDSKGDPLLEPRLAKLQSAVIECKNKFQAKENDYQQQIRQLNQEIGKLRDNNQRLLDQKNKLKQTVSNKHNELEDHNSSLTELVDRKNREIKQLQENNSKLRLKVTSVEGTIDDLRTQIAQNQLEAGRSTQKTIETLKNECLEASRKMDLLKMALEEAQRDRDDLRVDKKRMASRVQELEQMLMNAQAGIAAQINGGQQEETYQESQRMLKAKIEQCDFLKKDREALEQQTEQLRLKIRQLLTKNKAITDNLTSVQEQINVISVKYTQKVKELKEIENSKVGLERKLKEREEEIRDLTHEVSQASASVLSHPGDEARNLRVLEKELTLSKTQISISKENEHKLASEREKLSMEVRRLQHIIAEGSKQLQVVQSQKEHLTKENAEIIKQLESGYGSDTLLKQELSRLKAKIQAQQVFIEELRSAVKSEQHQNKLLNSQVSKLQSEGSKQHSKNSSLYEDNKQLTLHLRDSESKRKELMDQVKALKERTSNTQGSSLEARQAIGELENRCRSLEVQLQQKVNSILALDREKDQVQNLLDEKTVLAAELVDRLRLNESSTHQFSRGLSEKEYALTSLTAQIHKLESEKENIIKQCEMLDRAVKDITDRLTRSQNNSKELENQIRLISFSHKEQQAELERCRIRIADLDKRLKTRQKDYEDEREKTAAAQIMNKELTEQLQVDRVEIVRLEALVKELEKENNNMFYHLENRDREVIELKHALDDFHRQEMLHVQQISHYEKRVQSLGAQIEGLQSEKQDLARQCGSYRLERNWKSQSTSTIAWKVALEDRLRSIQAELELKKRECEEFRARIKDYEAALIEQRNRAYNLQRQVIRPHSTPIKDIVDSRLESENWDSSNHEYQSATSECVSNIPVRDRSFLSDVESVCSKKRLEKMQQLEEAYATTVQEQARLRPKR